MTLEKTWWGTPLAAVLLAVLVVLFGAGTRALGASGPNTYVKSSPSSPTNKTAASFAFYSTVPGDAKFQCSLDGATFRPCESPTGYESLAEGRHTFKVRSVDSAGGGDPTPASRSWAVDLTPPRTSLAVGENEATRSVARFEFSADEPVSGFHCSLDGAAPSRCVSPKAYTGLSAGDHAFEVYARDKAGNYDATPEAAAWTVGEDPAPVVTIEGAPRIESYHEYHYFGFSADAPDSSFFCSLDGEPFAPCLSGVYRYVPYGQHLFRVYAVSPGGVVGEAAAVEYESRDPNWD